MALLQGETTTAIAQRAPSSPNQGASLGLGLGLGLLGHHQPCLGLLGHLYGQLLNSQVSDLAPSSPTSTSSTRVPQQPSCLLPAPHLDDHLLHHHGGVVVHLGERHLLGND